MSGDKKKNRTLSASMVLAGIILFLLSGSSPTDVAKTEFERNNPGEGTKDYEFDAVLEGIRVE